MIRDAARAAPDKDIGQQLQTPGPSPTTGPDRVNAGNFVCRYRPAGESDKSDDDDYRDAQLLPVLVALKQLQRQHYSKAIGSVPSYNNFVQELTFFLLIILL